MINHSAIEGLRLLLQASLGEMPKGIPQGFDIQDVFELSQRQGVTALSFDGLKKLAEVYPEILENTSSARAVKLKWIASMVAQEKLYRENLLAANELSDFLSENNIYTYVLKGTSISRLYPVPSHRFSCDLDCFLVSKDGISDAYTMGNSLVASKGVRVDTSYYKHSVFQYKGLKVENHHFCCSIKRSKRTKELELYLEVSLKNFIPEYLQGTTLALPPQMFQALFMIEHANGHFLYSKMTIKHVCDWIVIKRSFKDTLNWEEFNRVCTRFGLKDFVCCMDKLADYLLGYCNYQDLQPLGRRVLDDTFKELCLSSNKMRQRIEKALVVLHSSWKFKHFCADSMIKELTHSAWAYLITDNPHLD